MSLLQRPPAKAAKSADRRAGTWPDGWAWWRCPMRARLFSGGCVIAAVALTVALSARRPSWDMVGTLCAVGVASAANVELGRWAEGRRIDRDRTHKGLSAWPFVAALILPVGACGIVAMIAYTHTRIRGVRFTLWKWCLSWAMVTLAAMAAGALFHGLASNTIGRTGSTDELLAVIAAIALFIGCEAAGFFAISRLNSVEDERPLRASLASPHFYTNELAVLTAAVVSAVLFRHAPAYLVFAAPMYVWMQQAVLHEPLRHEAAHDAKTGLLNFSAWREVVSADLDAGRLRDGCAFGAVIIIDIDHFKAINDSLGHLIGDEVIATTATAIASCIRPCDKVARFGGDEFCVFLAAASLEDARRTAERIRDAIHHVRHPAVRQALTASLGVCAADERGLSLDDLVSAADTRLYDAKLNGRDQVAA